MYLTYVYIYTHIVYILIPGDDLINIHQHPSIFTPCFFASGAALELFMLGLLDAEGLRSAAHGDLEEFGEINVVDFASSEVPYAAEGSF